MQTKSSYVSELPKDTVKEIEFIRISRRALPDGSGYVEINIKTEYVQNPSGPGTIPLYKCEVKILKS